MLASPPNTPPPPTSGGPSGQPLAKGYPDWLLIVEIPKELELRCTLCSWVMKESVIFSCKCSLSVCKGCADRWLAGHPDGSRLCPACREPVGEMQPNLRARSMIGQLRVRCVHSEEGCGWQGTVSEMEDVHLPKECVKRLVQRVQMLEDANRQQNAHIASLLDANAQLVRRLNEFIASERERAEKEQARVEAEQQAKREAEEEFDQIFRWRNDGVGLLFTNRKKTVTNTNDDYTPVVNIFGFHRGIHRWKISVDEAGHPPGVGVCSQDPMIGYGANYDIRCDFCFHGASNEENWLTLEEGDVVSVELDCDAHTLTLTNPRSDSGYDSMIVTNLPADKPLVPFVHLSGRNESPTTLTLLPF